MQIVLAGTLKRETNRSSPTPEFRQVAPWIWRTLDGYRSGRLVPGWYSYWAASCDPLGTPPQKR